MKKWILPFAAILMLGAGAAAADESKAITLSRLASFNHGNEFDAGQAEIVAYDAGSKRVFVINAADGTVDILDVSNPKTPVKTGQINVTDNLVSEDVGGVNSVAAHNGLVAVAVENGNQQADGWAAFYDAYGNFKTYVKVGALPDAITFTKNGKYVLVANEGQPNGDYTVDPEGSVSVIDVRNGVLSAVVKTAGFTAFNGVPPAGVRISGPVGTTVAQDLEPEYIATSKDSKTA